MYFALTKEQLDLQAALRGLLEERMPEAVVRALMDEPAGDDPHLWRELMTLVGAGDQVHSALVLEVLGETLYVGPYLSSAVLGGALLQLAGDPVSLAAVRSGLLRVTLAALDESGDAASCVEVHNGRVNGVVSFVLDGMTADRLLVLANDEGQPCFVAVEATATGVARTPLPGLDQTRKLARIAFVDAAAEVLPVQDVPAALDQLQQLTSAAVAAEQVGCAQAAFHAALSYAKRREQFGRVIGSYQAIKHRFADLALSLEQARAAAYNAAWVIENRPQEISAATALARVVCTQASVEVSEACVQIRGGQGFRWDNVAHLYLKRAKSSQLLFGDPGVERERIAEFLELT